MGMQALQSKKLRLSPSKLGAPQNQEPKLIDGFQSKLKVEKILQEKHDLGDGCKLNVEQIQGLKLDFEKLWVLS